MPSELYELSSLNQLALSRNALSGSLATEIGQLQALEMDGASSKRSFTIGTFTGATSQKKRKKVLFNHDIF